jgi:hypothetical protein
MKKLDSSTIIWVSNTQANYVRENFSIKFRYCISEKSIVPENAYFMSILIKISNYLLFMFSTSEKVALESDRFNEKYSIALLLGVVVLIRFWNLQYFFYCYMLDIHFLNKHFRPNLPNLTYQQFYSTKADTSIENP